MARYLVSLTLGPVQSLIEAARRTRDLWCGSWLLAESAKAAARVLQEAHPGCLIFPCPEDAARELAATPEPSDDEANVANILRAELDLPDAAAVRELLAKARQAAEDQLAAYCLNARQALERCRIPIHADLWKMQQVDILECYAAWVEIRDGDYAEASDRLGGVMAARKATRDFLPAARTANEAPAFGIPKSSLDGARESVLNLPRKERNGRAHQRGLRQLGLAGGEELDVLAVAKRLAGDMEQFTAYSRLAADPWIESCSDEVLKPLREAYEPLVAAQLATRIKGNRGCYQRFPYDAQLVFGFRLDNAIATAIDEEDRRLLSTLRAALKGLQQPVPYAVILKADGDRMGELLGRAKTANDSQEISRALHGFACSVRRTVREHRGHAIYAGGDDVLALLPLDSAVACAAHLADDFRKAMGGVASRLGVAAGESPTLSVGLGIGHLVEPLGGLRARADAAEKHAKGDGLADPRNALAIRLGVRSGAELDWRCRWGEAGAGAANCAGIEALQQFVDAYRNGECSTRVAYELREIADRLAWAMQNGDGAAPLPGIHAAELSRTLDRARKPGDKGSLSQAFRQALVARATTVGLAALADELILARWLSARTQQDLGENE